MIRKFVIPILYPLKPKELEVDAFFVDGIIDTIDAVVDEVPFCFTKNMDGFFESKAVAEGDSSYIKYIERQLSRMFT